MVDLDWSEIKADWDDGQLVVAIAYPSILSANPEESVVMAQIESFTPRISTPHDINDSLNNHNMGKIDKPARFTFDLNVFPHGKAVDLLNKIQYGNRYFDLVLAPASYFDAVEKAESAGQPVTNVWVEGKAVFRAAFVNDKSTRISVGSKPVTTFSCGALRYVFDQFQDGSRMLIIGNGFASLSATDAEVGLDNLVDVGGPE